MAESIQFLESDRDDDGRGGGLALSILIHAIVIAAILLRPVPPKKTQEKPLQYVDLVKTEPKPVAVAKPASPRPSFQGRNRQFIEAPGPKADKPPANAPLSNANRRASTPKPTGDKPTNRPGVGGEYIPGGPATPPKAQEKAPESDQPGIEKGKSNEKKTGTDGQPPGLRYESRTLVDGRKGQNANSPKIDWNSAIRDAGKANPGLAGALGGDKGFAESGPVSFESTWYPWGDYAAAMIRKIRYHWYANMPELVRLGVQGVVIVRFTIQRSGRITDVTILKSSGSPPYDYAARKAIELSSPLQPLPSDFPNPTERVTAGFYYNLSPPR